MSLGASRSRQAPPGGHTSRRFPAAFVLGKFLPPHAGHLHLIDAVRARCDRVYVLACSLRSEPIPGPLRARWLRELRPDVTVVEVTDENPQEPREDPRFWEIWTDTIRRALPGPVEAVFSSEGYGDELARRLSIEHVCVDAARAAVPVSGSSIRERPAAHWQHVPSLVRPALVKRVVITGPESTGKTTLAASLAARYGAPWVPEQARAYLDSVNAGRRERGEAPSGPTDICREEDLEPIARLQAAAEDAAAAASGAPVIFLDTDLVVTKMYAELYFGRCAAWIAAEARRRRYDRHLLLHPDVPWVADPQRDQPHARERLLDVLRGELAAPGARVTEVSGSFEERFQRAVAVVDEVLAEPMRPLLSEGE